jgi:cytochrome P450
MTLDVFSNVFLADRYSVFAQLQAQTSIHYREQGDDWLVLRHKDVKRFFEDHQRFRSAPPHRTINEASLDDSGSAIVQLLRSALDIQQLWLPQRDPPDHTRIKRVIQPMYHRQRLEQVQAHTSDLADKLLDDIISTSSNQIDLVEAYITPLMQAFIGYLFNIPSILIPKLGNLSQDILLALEFDQEDFIYQQGHKAFSQFYMYFKSRFSAHQQPEQVLEDLVNAHHEGHMTELESIAQSIALYVAGHTTTLDLIGSAIYYLLQNRDLYNQALNSTERISDLVQETLRYEPPGQYFVRWTHTDIDLHGKHIPAGSRILLVVAAANRDPNIFEKPHEFNIDRSKAQSLSFGSGIHYCVGAHVAPRIAYTAIERLLDRLPQLMLDDTAPQWKTTFMFRGLKALPVTYS